MSATQGGNTRKYKIIAFVEFLVIAAVVGVAAWFLLSGNSSTPSVHLVPTTLEPPSKEDCMAISLGNEIIGQDPSPKTFTIEMKMAMNHDVNIDFLLKELQFKIQQDVLPILAGCDNGGSVTIKNNIFIVKNALLNSISVSDPANCDSFICFPVTMSVDIFVGDDDVSSAALSDIVKDVFQDEGLLYLLNLATPVKSIDVNTVFEIFPSSVPSLSP